MLVRSNGWRLSSSLDECYCIVCSTRSFNLVNFSDVTIMTSSVAVSTGVCCGPPRVGSSLGCAFYDLPRNDVTSFHHF